MTQYRFPKGYKSGRWNVECMRCGFYFKSDYIVQDNITEVLVCLDCQDPIPIDYLIDINPERAVPKDVFPDGTWTDVRVQPTNDPYNNYYQADP